MAVKLISNVEAGMEKHFLDLEDAVNRGETKDIERSKKRYDIFSAIAKEEGINTDGYDKQVDKLLEVFSG